MTAQAYDWVIFSNPRRAGKRAAATDPYCPRCLGPVRIDELVGWSHKWPNGCSVVVISPAYRSRLETVMTERYRPSYTGVVTSR